MSKLTRESVAKLVRVRRTALYNAAGRRHGSIHHKRSKSVARWLKYVKRNA